MRRFFTIRLRVVVIAFLILAAIPMEIQAHESTTTLNALIQGEDAKYYVQIPEAIAFGKLSKNKDNEKSYTVSVQVIDLNGGSIEVSAEQEGDLIGEKRSQDSVIPFENKFNKVSLKENKDLEGNLYIRKEAVASTKQGNYKGVVNFTMSYMLGNTTPTVPSNPGDNGNNNNNGSNNNNSNNNNSNNSNNGSSNNNNSNNNTNNNGNNSLQNNTYTAKMSLRKETDINSTSMCDSLFFGYADIVVQGENAQITFYVIDPIPQYPSEGTPLSDIVFETSGQKYEANIDTSNKVIRMYDPASGFIPSAGKYPSDVVTVTVPTSAVENSASGALKCSAYVNAVMKSIQSFYIVFSELQAGETSENLAPPENLVLTSPSGSGTSSSSQEDTKTLDTSNLSDGTYSIPISARKETTNESSMMNEYMYPYAQLEVANKKLSLTVHIQHQVAGIEGGGPEYIIYEGTKAAKKSAGFTNNGMKYDSFTIELGEQINTTMLVTMYVNAMSIEVKARLILDLSQLKEGTTKSGMENGVKTAAKDSTKNSTKDDTEGEHSSDHDKIVNGNSEIDVEKNIRIIRFVAQSTGIKILLVIIAVVLMGILGIAGNLRYRRHSI